MAVANRLASRGAHACRCHTERWCMGMRNLLVVELISKIRAQACGRGARRCRGRLLQPVQLPPAAVLALAAAGAPGLCPPATPCDGTRQQQASCSVSMGGCSTRLQTASQSPSLRWAIVLPSDKRNENH